MTPDEIRKAFEEHGVIMTGHFKLTSGRHSDLYVQKQRVLEDPGLTMRLATEIVSRFPPGSFDVVASPAVGAIALGAFVAYAAGVRFVFTERVGDAMTLRRGQHLGAGDRVLVVEDIVTTGGSAGEVVDLARASGAELAGVAVIADRSMSPPPYPLTALLRVEARDWAPDECPLCAKGLSIVSPGSRHLAR